MGSYTFPLLCVVLSDFFILLGISSTGCSSLSAELFTSGLSSRMLSVWKVQRIIEALWWQLALCRKPLHAKCKGTVVTQFRHMVGKTDSSLSWKCNMNIKVPDKLQAFLVTVLTYSQQCISHTNMNRSPPYLSKTKSNNRREFYMPPFLLQIHREKSEEKFRCKSY